MTEYEQRAMGLLGEKHIGRMLLFRPSEDLLDGLVRLGASCDVLSADEVDKLSAGQDTLSGEYICMMIGELPEVSADPVKLLSCLQRHLSPDGALVAVSKCLSAEETSEIIKQAKFRDICFDRFGETWIYRAQIMMSKTIMLQRQFTPEVRHILLYLLRRIETGIDTEKNVQLVWALCEKEKVTVDFLLPFIENTMIKPQRVLRLLAGTAGE